MKYVARSDYPQWLRLALGNNVFSLGATQAAVAAKFSLVQLLNPPGSLVTVVILGVTDGVTAVAGEVRWNNTAGATLIGTGKATRGGVANSSAQVYTDAQTALAGTVVQNILAGDSLQLSTLQSGLYVLDPGVGIQIDLTIVNTALTTNFLWAELS